MSAQGPKKIDFELLEKVLGDYDLFGDVTKINPKVLHSTLREEAIIKSLGNFKDKIESHPPGTFGGDTPNDKTKYGSLTIGYSKEEKAFMTNLLAQDPKMAKQIMMVKNVFAESLGELIKQCKAMIEAKNSEDVPAPKRLDLLEHYRDIIFLFPPEGLEPQMLFEQLRLLEVEVRNIGLEEQKNNVLIVNQKQLEMSQKSLQRFESLSDQQCFKVEFSKKIKPEGVAKYRQAISKLHERLKPDDPGYTLIEVLNQNFELSKLKPNEEGYIALPEELLKFGVSQEEMDVLLEALKEEGIYSSCTEIKDEVEFKSLISDPGEKAQIKAKELEAVVSDTLSHIERTQKKIEDVRNQKIPTERNLDFIANFEKKGGYTQYLAQQLNDLPLESRVALLADMMVRRYNKQKMNAGKADHTQGFNQVIRNPQCFTRGLLDEISKQIGFPFSKETQHEFFDLVQNVAKDQNPNSSASQALVARLTPLPTEMLKVILPFFDEYMKDVENAMESVPESERPAFIEKARNGFIGQITFPLIESQFKVLTHLESNERENVSKMLRDARDLFSQQWLEQLDGQRSDYERTPVQDSVIERVLDQKSDSIEAFESFKQEIQNQIAELVEQANAIYVAGNGLMNVQIDKENLLKGPLGDNITRLTNFANAKKSDLEQLKTINIRSNPEDLAKEIELARQQIQDINKQFAKALTTKNENGMSILKQVKDLSEEKHRDRVKVVLAYTKVPLSQKLKGSVEKLKQKLEALDLKSKFVKKFKGIKLPKINLEQLRRPKINLPSLRKVLISLKEKMPKVPKGGVLSKISDKWSAFRNKSKKVKQNVNPIYQEHIQPWIDALEQRKGHIQAIKQWQNNKESPFPKEFVTFCQEENLEVDEKSIQQYISKKNSEIGLCKNKIKEKAKEHFDPMIGLENPLDLHNIEHLQAALDYSKADPLRSSHLEMLSFMMDAEIYLNHKNQDIDPQALQKELEKLFEVHLKASSETSINISGDMRPDSLEGITDKLLEQIINECFQQEKSNLSQILLKEPLYNRKPDNIDPRVQEYVQARKQNLLHKEVAALRESQPRGLLNASRTSSGNGSLSQIAQDGIARFLKETFGASNISRMDDQVTITFPDHESYVSFLKELPETSQTEGLNGLDVTVSQSVVEEVRSKQEAKQEQTIDEPTAKRSSALKGGGS